MINETEQAKRLLLKYGAKKGSMSFSNVNPETDIESLLDLALGINSLQATPVQTIVCVSSSTLEKE